LAARGNFSDFSHAIAYEPLESVERVAKADMSKPLPGDRFDGIANSLKKGEGARLVGFGAFSARERKAGKGRNRSAGEEIMRPAPRRTRASSPTHRSKRA